MCEHNDKAKFPVDIYYVGNGMVVGRRGEEMCTDCFAKNPNALAHSEEFNTNMATALVNRALRLEQNKFN